MILDFEPIPIQGLWDKGFSLSLHTLESYISGYDRYGEPIIYTKRTPIGEAIYKLKYRGDHSVVDSLVDTLKYGLDILGVNTKVLIPTPSSDDNKPSILYIIAEKLSNKYGYIAIKALRIKGGKSVKDIATFSERVKELEGRVTVKESVSDLIEGKHIILLDDVFRSGATLSVATRKLKEHGAAYVYAITFTKTRVKR